MSDEPMEQVLVRMPPAMAEAVRSDAAANDRTLAATVRRAVRGYLEDRKVRSIERHRILWNVRGHDIDEIVIDHPELVHVEQMDDRCWWIGIYLPAGNNTRRWSGHFRCDSRGRMTFTEQDCDLVWDEDESHEETN